MDTLKKNKMSATKEEVAELVRDNKDVAEKWVTMVTDDIEKNTPFRMSPANKKSPYHKACWLLYLYQKTHLYSANNEKVADMVFIAKIAMKALQ